MLEFFMLDASDDKAPLGGAREDQNWIFILWFRNAHRLVQREGFGCE
jgi:hypothetical protein